MTLDEYQNRCKETAVYPNKSVGEGVNYTILGLLGEAGELANKYKKVLRDEQGILSLEKRSEMFQELGDVLWYVAMLASELSCTLSEVAIANVYKLQVRKSKNTLQGSGDNR